MQERQRCDYACSESLAAAYSLHSVYVLTDTYYVVVTVMLWWMVIAN